MACLNADYYKDLDRAIELKEQADILIRDSKFSLWKSFSIEEKVKMIGHRFVDMLLFLYSTDNGYINIAEERYDDYNVMAKLNNWDLSPYIKERHIDILNSLIKYKETYDTSLVINFSKVMNRLSDSSFVLIKEKIETLDEFTYEYLYSPIEDIEVSSFFNKEFKELLKTNYDDLYKEFVLNESMYLAMNNSDFATHIFYHKPLNFEMPSSIRFSKDIDELNNKEKYQVYIEYLNFLTGEDN